MIWYIGGSPCSGKSTAAEALSAHYDAFHFKADDFLDEFTARGARLGLPVCCRIQSMTPDEIWMRPPHLQCREELDYYREIAPFATEKLHELPHQRIIAEGAAFLPCLMQEQDVPADRYIAIVPEKGFQISRYRQRPWVPHVLKDCADPNAAFANWMERDALFALDIRRQCRSGGYRCLITDGTVAPDERLAQIAAHFQLGAPVCQEHA